MTEKRSRPSRPMVWCFIGALGCMLAVVVVNAVVSGRVTWETVLHVFGAISKRESSNLRDINGIATLLMSLTVHNVEPPPKVADLFRSESVPSRVLNRFADVNGKLSDNVIAGIDRFGTPYVYETRLVGAANDRFVRYEVRIRSAGANRRDEGGRGDDVQRDVEIIHDRGAE